MRTGVLAMILACSLAAGESAPNTGTVIDQSVRFVNDRIVTIGDIRSRNGIRVELWRRAGRVLPDTRDGLLRFNRETLEELTDEELLVQKAEELKISIDRDRLANEVINEARERGLALRDIAVLRKIRDREAKVDAILGMFEGRAATISPSELQQTYERRKADFARPPRARSLLLALRPSGEDERRDLVKALAGLMRVAQTDADAAIAGAATTRLDAFLAADIAGQERILADVAAAIALLAGRDGLGAESAALAKRAAELSGRWLALRSKPECEQQLTALRSELMQLPPAQRAALFSERARAISQGPHAADGGMLGWVEPKTYGAEIEEQALAMPVNEPSAPFPTGGSIALLLVLEREEGRTQGFAEVSAALQAALDRERRAEVRNRVTGMLRAQASIRDVVDLDALLR